MGSLLLRRWAREAAQPLGSVDRARRGYTRITDHLEGLIVVLLSIAHPIPELLKESMDYILSAEGSSRVMPFAVSESA